MQDAMEIKAEQIVSDVLELPPAQRTPAVDRACGRDAALRARVDTLLRASAAAGDFMADPTVAPGADATLDPSAVAAPSTARVGERPGDLIGPYKLLEQIGEGGFGVVFMAEQQRPVRRRVAIKVIKLGMDTREVVARFEAERQALAMMDHPSIAKVFDAGATATGRPYFVMELVRGSPVTEYADKHKLTTRDRVALAAQVCRAVQHAHSKGVIHRDLKPTNVLVTVTDDRPVPKVIDFGIAKATQAKLTDMTLFTAHRQLIGTPQYMSPEQADSDGSDIDTRTDVYSLGVLIYELLVGATPLDARSLRSAAFDAMRRMIAEADTPHLSVRLSGLGETSATVATNRATDVKQLTRQLHGELDWIVIKSLDKDRSRRYDTAAALADDLGRYLAGEAVLAGPVSGAYRLRKTLRRYRATVAVTAAIAACLLLGVAGTTWGLIQARANERRAFAGEAAAHKQRAIALANEQRALAGEASADRQRAVVESFADADKADLLLYRGSLSEAESLYRTAWQRQRSLLGGDDPRTIGTMQRCVALMSRVGRSAEAEAAMADAVDADRRAGRAGRPEFADLLVAVATASQDPTVAGPWFEEALSLLHAGPQDDPKLTSVLLSYAKLLQAAGRPDKARSRLEEAVAVEWRPKRIHPAPRGRAARAGRTAAADGGHGRGPAGRSKRHRRLLRDGNAAGRPGAATGAVAPAHLPDPTGGVGRRCGPRVRAGDGPAPAAPVTRSGRGDAEPLRGVGPFGPDVPDRPPTGVSGRCLPGHRRTVGRVVPAQSPPDHRPEIAGRLPGRAARRYGVGRRPDRDRPRHLRLRGCAPGRRTLHPAGGRRR